MRIAWAVALLDIRFELPNAGKHPPRPADNDAEDEQIRDSKGRVTAPLAVHRRTQ